MKYKSNKVPIIFEFEGERFKTFECNFHKWPKTRLSRLIKSKYKSEILSLCDGFEIDKDGIKKYTFYRNPQHFNVILDLYRTGEMHRVKHSCAIMTKEEMTFWGIDELEMEVCCNSEYVEEQNSSKKINEETREWAQKEYDLQSAEENWGNKISDQIRKKIWYLTEHPGSSLAAKACTL